MSGHQFLKKPNPRRMIGAAMAEYMPILGIGLITAMAGYQQYGDVITDHIGDMAQEMASNYYQGWFYPEGTPGLAAPGGSGRHKDSGGPDDSDGSGGDGSDGDGGDTQPGDGNVPPIDDLFPDPGGGGGGGMCLGPGGGDPGYFYPLGGSSQGGVSTAPTYTVAGNPIDFGTGNKFQVESDFQHYGETPLKFERYYNSRQSNKLTSLGHGWRHSYQRQLSDLVDLEGQISDTYRKIVRDDGSVYLFRLEQDRWIGQGVVDQLEKTESGWRYITLNQVIETYNEAGQLQSVKYPNGVIHQLTYKNNQLVSVSDSRGDQLTFNYEGHSEKPWLSRVELPNNTVLRFQYSEKGNLKGFQRLGDSIWSQVAALWQHNTATYHYENQQLNHALTGITDAEGKRYATWGYDDLGRANLSEHGNGVERLTFDYRSDGTVAMTNEAGLVTVFHLEAARPGYRRLVRVDGKATPTCPEVRQDHQYNEQGYLRLAVDAEGSATEYQRNQRGLVTRQDNGLTRQQGQWLPVEGTSRVERRWHNTLPLVTEEILSRYHQGRWQSYRKADFQYNDAGRLLSLIETDLTQQTLPYSTYGDQRHWAYSYTFDKQNVGQIATLAINGPRKPLADGSDDITTYRFNDRGLLEEVVNPMGHTITIDQYNSDGQPTQATLANDLQITLDYNALGQTTGITRRGQSGKLSETTEMDYDRNGLVTRLTLPDGSWQSFDYNDARQIIEIRNNWGERINLEPSRVSGEWTAQLVYDSKGNLIRQSERALDSLGRVIKLLGQHGQEVVLAYNKLGDVLTTTEAGKDEKRITRNDYNAISQLTQVIDAMNGSTRFEYGQTGGISEVVAANGAVTRYRYNGFGDTIQVDSPDTGVIVYDYDSAGNKIRAGSGHLRRSIVAENAAEHA
ncbi:DUF6531 domain-containing protein, partial [Endozoicomonas sp. ALC013]|uniref:DUF6531 domain-containing protein n=1 Tax=Endozoicomonas sp. ALC013 TaxID=3403076 RepID=UPI003BB797C8